MFTQRFVYICVTHNAQKKRKKKEATQMSVCRWMDKQTVKYYSAIEEWTMAANNNMNAVQIWYCKWKNPVSKGHIIFHLYDSLEKEKMQALRTDQWLPGVRVGEDWLLGDMREIFGGAGNVLDHGCGGGYMTICSWKCLKLYS